MNLSTNTKSERKSVVRSEFSVLACADYPGNQEPIKLLDFSFACLLINNLHIIIITSMCFKDQSHIITLSVTVWSTSEEKGLWRWWIAERSSMRKFTLGDHYPSNYGTFAENKKLVITRPSFSLPSAYGSSVQRFQLFREIPPTAFFRVRKPCRPLQREPWESRGFLGRPRSK